MLSSSEDLLNNNISNNEVLAKMAEIVNNLHISLVKLRKFKDNYRDLSDEE